LAPLAGRWHVFFFPDVSELKQSDKLYVIS
jgi:hypothetical protein